jgi:hypothetical protein
LFSIFCDVYLKLKNNSREYIHIHKLKQVEEQWGFEKLRIIDEAITNGKLNELDNVQIRQNARAKLDEFIKQIEEM